MHCQIRLCSWFVIILKYAVFLVPARKTEDEEEWYGAAGGCFTDVVLHSSINYR